MSDPTFGHHRNRHCRNDLFDFLKDQNKSAELDKHTVVLFVLLSLKTMSFYVFSVRVELTQAAFVVVQFNCCVFR